MPNSPPRKKSDRPCSNKNGRCRIARDPEHELDYSVAAAICQRIPLRFLQDVLMVCRRRRPRRPWKPKGGLCMSDYKSVYSEAAQYYVEETVPSSEIDQGRFDRSKKREEKYNENWKERPVNLNEICDKFAPGDAGHKEGVKFVFEGDDYKVVADMATGYLRIQDLNSGKYVTLDGAPSALEETHFKILRREEM